MSTPKNGSFRGNRARGGKKPLTAAKMRLAAKTQEHMARALDLVVAGKSVKAVAEELQVSNEYARQLIDKALSERDEDLGKRKEQARSITLARLDTLIEGLWEKRASPYVVKVLTDLEDRRAKLLGLDQAQEVNHTVNVTVSDVDLLSKAAAYGIQLGVQANGPRLGEVIDASPAPLALPPSPSSEPPSA